MKYVKIIVALIIIGVVLIAIYGGSCRGTVKTGLRGIYEQFRAHYESGDLEAMEAMLTENARKRIANLADNNFQAGLEKKLVEDKMFKKALTIESSDELDRILSGKMMHLPDAFEKAVRNARNTANQAENLIKQKSLSSSDKQAQLDKEIANLTATYQAELQAAMSKEGEESVKSVVHSAMMENKSADVVTLRDAVEKALESSGIAKLQNNGFLRFGIGAGGNYRWEVTKVPNVDEWKINVP